MNTLQVELVNFEMGVGGINRYTHELLRYLTPHISVRPVRSISPPLAGRFSFLHHLPVGIQTHRPSSIVHFTRIMGCAVMLWRNLHPAVATVHDLGWLVWPQERLMYSAFDFFLLRLSLLGLKRMDGIVAVSEFTRQTVIEKLRISPSKVHTVYSGIDHELFQPKPDARHWLNKRYGIPNEPPIKNILYIGSELPRKNLSTLLKAVALLRQSGMDIRLIKVGNSGGDRFRSATIACLADLKLEPDVLFFENVPDAELPYFYSAADVFVFPSFIEGFGFPVLEAMACGTPVVCSNAGSLPEVVEKAAILIDPHDASALAAAVISILKDAQRRETLSELGRHQAAKFTWQKSVGKLIEIYRLNG